VNGKKDFAWLKDRYTVLMGRAPEEKDLARLMKVKDVLGIDYDDPAILHLLAFEYYGQLYEQVPEKIQKIITETEAYASKHFEQKAAVIAQQQVTLISKASNRSLDLLVDGANKMIAETGDQGKRVLSTFILNEFAQVVKPGFFQAAEEARMATREIRGFGRNHRWVLIVTSAISGLVSALVVLGLTYLFWGRA
jgi:hypothetical protein